MGYLHYDGHTAFAFDDRTLTHLRTTILGKLGMQESTVFTWNDNGYQRSIWLHPGSSLQFEFESDETPEISSAWIELLLTHANSGSGLRLVPEPARPDRSEN